MSKTCPTCGQTLGTARSLTRPADKTNQVPTVEQTARLLEQHRSKQTAPPPADLRKHLPT